MFGSEWAGRDLPSWSVVYCSLAYWLITRKDFLETFEAIGVDLEDWPNEFPRQACEKYLELRNERTHEYAWYNMQIATEVLENKLFRDGTHPEDVVLLSDLYHAQVERDSLLMIARRIERDPKTATEQMEKFLATRTGGKGSPKIHSFSEWVQKFETDGTFLSKQFLSKTVIPDFKELSEAIGGFNPGRVSILIGDTGFGKTNAGIQLAVKAAQKMPVAYFNMEMIPVDFTKRIVQSISDKRSVNDLDFKYVAQSELGDKLFISDGRDMGVSELRGTIARLVKRHRVEFVVIDYDQKLRLSFDRGQQEWQALQKAIEAIEDIAKGNGIHCMVLAQSNLEGGISGSRRSLFSASTVLRFYEHESHGPVIEAVKNRFGKRSAAVSIEYNPALAILREGRPLDLSQTKKKLERVP